MVNRFYVTLGLLILMGYFIFGVLMGWIDDSFGALSFYVAIIIYIGLAYFLRKIGVITI